MKIKINREIDVPDGFTCNNRRRCPALTTGVEKNDDLAICSHFNRTVFFRPGVGYVKCQDCVDAIMCDLNGRKMR